MVISKRGRDKGKQFVVVGFQDEDIALISDGKLRKVEKPKKKKLKHLVFTDTNLDEVRDSLLSGRDLVNAHVRKAIKKVGYDTYFEGE